MAKTQNRTLMSHPMGKWGLFMGFLFALWFGGWFAIASYADGEIEEAIGSIADYGIDVECDNRDMIGFPFRIGVRCTNLNIAHKRDAFRIELGEARTLAQLYSPGELVAEVDGPFRSWPSGVEVNAKWSALRLYLDGHLDGGFDLASLTFSDLTARSAQTQIATPTGALHVRPTPLVDAETPGSSKSLDVALNLSKLSLQLPKGAIPEATLEADLTLIDGYTDLVKNRRPLRAIIKDGAQFEIRNAVLITPDGGRLVIAGPVELNNNGQITGKIRIGIADPKSVAAWFDQINPQITPLINFIGQSVSATGKPQMIGRAEIRSIALTINRGRVSLGLIPIGKIPPLFQN